MDIDRIHQQVSEELKLIAHPIRLRILLALVDEPSLQVSVLHHLLSIEQAVISLQLNKMKDRGLLVSKRQGKSIHYALANPGLVEQIKQILDRLNRG